ncbi:MAG: hypothetical protein ACE5KA_09360 [Nitrososphaerales archaeon]
MVELAELALWVGIAEGIATVAVVFFLWRAVTQMNANVEFNKIQVQHRFRPWVGPCSGIEFLSTNSGKEQFAIRIRNFGELPASGVKALSVLKEEKPTREVLKADGVSSFNLGPLLPNMEKKYWIFIDSDLMRKAKANSTQIFVALYFAYEFPGVSAGYGMISQFDAAANTFVHKEMWVD